MAEPQAATEVAGDDVRASVLAGLEELGSPVEIGGSGETAEPSPDGQATDADADAAPDEVADEEGAAEEAPSGLEGDEGDDPRDADEETEEGLDDEAEASTDKPDPKLEARLERIQAEEKRSKERVRTLMAEKEAEIEQKIRKWERENEPRLQKAEEFERLSSEAKYDPVGAFTALGLSEDDFEAAARALYAHSKAGRENPQLREQAHRSLRERRYADELAATRKELESIREERQQERQVQEQRAEAERYLGSVAQAVTDESPLTQRLMDGDRDEAMEEFRVTALRMLEETGEDPAPAEVVARVEKDERARLKKRGIDPDEVLGKTKNKTLKAGERRAAKTLTNSMTNSKSPRRKPQTRQEEIDDVRRALESGQLE